jgi:hypothetical protein
LPRPHLTGSERGHREPASQIMRPGVHQTVPLAQLPPAGPAPRLAHASAPFLAALWPSAVVPRPDISPRLVVSTVLLFGSFQICQMRSCCGHLSDLKGMSSSMSGRRCRPAARASQAVAASHLPIHQGRRSRGRCEHDVSWLGGTMQFPSTPHTLIMPVLWPLGKWDTLHRPIFLTFDIRQFMMGRVWHQGSTR